METKICYHCKKSKPFSDFYKSKTHKCGYGSWCKSCQKKRLRQKHKESPDFHRAYNIKLKYGISLEDYDKLFEQQNGLCAICSRPETRKSPNGWIYRLSVDHNHVSGEVRGLLCKSCNTAIGALLVDDRGSILIENALGYIRGSNA